MFISHIRFSLLVNLALSVSVYLFRCFSHGGWITGINAIDTIREGNIESMPLNFSNNKGRNIYYLFPLLFGVLGLVVQSINGEKNFWPSVLRILERSFRLTASSGSGSLTYMEKPEVWLLKGGQNISGLYRLLSHRLPSLSGVS